MTDYVLGFAFTADLSRVLLVRKNRSPNNLGDKMLGKLNGIGGHIEPSDGFEDGFRSLDVSLTAMRRECMEEAGLQLNWTRFCTLSKKDVFRMFCFYAVGDEVEKFVQMEDEELALYDVRMNDIHGRSEGVWTEIWYQHMPRMANIDWLIPMAINHYKKLDSAERFEVEEV